MPKFTLTLNMGLTIIVIGAIAGISIYNQTLTPPGLISLEALFRDLTGPGVLAALSWLGHNRNPDGTQARVPYDSTRDKE
jgi:hypothetical protein